jgi:hypothetical protein
VYDKDGRKYVYIGYLVEVPNDENAEEEAVDRVICPVCGCIVSGVVHGDKKA